jgi:uncharacterized membrane protein YbhN (UPF0104 family)
MRRWIKPGLAILLFGAAAIYLFSSADNIRLLRRLDAVSIILIVLALLVNIYLNGLQCQLLAGGFGIRMTARESFGISAYNTMVNHYLPARGGTLLRAAYFKRVHALAYSHYAAILAVAYLVSFLLAAGLGLAITPLTRRTASGWPGEMAGIFGVLLAATVALTVVILLAARRPVKTRWPRLDRILALFGEGIRTAAGAPGCLARVAIVTILNILVFGCHVWLTFRALGLPLGLPETIVIQCLVYFSLVVSITPAHLGIQEGIIVFGSHLFGVAFAPATVAAIINRTLTTIVVFAAGLVFMRDFGMILPDDGGSGPAPAPQGPEISGSEPP